MNDQIATKKGVEFSREVWGLAGVSIVVSGLRMYQRISTVGLRGLAADDWGMVFITVLHTHRFSTLLVYLVARS
jgi:hypothetical protein